MCPIRPGQIIYELSGVSHTVSYKAMSQAGSKMPFPTKVIKLIY
jgi:ribosomal protein L16/L10AE